MPTYNMLISLSDSVEKMRKYLACDLMFVGVRGHLTRNITIEDYLPNIYCLRQVSCRH
ncbi:hypothetical protein Syun_018372 [Stephania yunnanensis]|uniref:Uncharacterized protein n=1 Tax=Stephania yunnanensis TaxID=152371 RepID=A0AAP0ISS7_9MAGN